MPHVAAGNITGKYYIVVAGLPWQCTWQKLKDFARNGDGTCQIDIDHAVVYPDSTDGWVRVIGKDNFKRAFAHLNGGILGNRCIVADGRNETQTTSLRDTIINQWPVSSSQKYREGSASSSMYKVSMENASDSPDSPCLTETSELNNSPTRSQCIMVEALHSNCYYPHPQAVDVGFFPAAKPFQDSSPHQPISPYEVTNPYQAYHSSQEYAQPILYSRTTYAGTSHMGPSSPVYRPAAQTDLPYRSQASSVNKRHFQSRSPHSSCSTSPVVQTEVRKIIITQLPHSTSETDLHKLLAASISHSFLSEKSSHSLEVIEEVEIAKHLDGALRGHAFVVFANHEIAKSVIETLDGSTFKGRILQARFAKEGVEPMKRFAESSEQIMAAERQWPLLSHNNSPRTNCKVIEEDHILRMQGSRTPRFETEASERKPRKEPGSEKRNRYAKTPDLIPQQKSSSHLRSPLVVDGSSCKGGN